MQPILFTLFIFSAFVILCYYGCIFRCFIVYKPQKSAVQNLPPVSVLICARNEAGNLRQVLPQIYAQKYPDFEVVLINDRSVDETFEVMKGFEEKYPRQTRIVEVPHTEDKRLRGKKYALTLGIKAARNNHLLFTDADCQPASEYWIEKTAGKFTSGKQIVLGYGAYTVQASWLNKLIRYETLQTALQFFSYALKGMPYMGVGRNLAYTREIFMQNKGFYNHMDILSGDDDLFIQETATASNTSIAVEPESFTLSQPQTAWKNYVYQKRRHISTARHYKRKHQFLLGFYHFNLLLFWLTAVPLFATGFYGVWVSGIFSFRLGFSWYVQALAARKLQEKKLIIWYPFLEISLLCFQMLIFVVNLFKKPVHWMR